MNTDPTADSGARPFYDLTNPVVWLRDEAEVTTVKGKIPVQHRAEHPAAPDNSSGKDDVQEYATRLLTAAMSQAPPSSALSPPLPTLPNQSGPESHLEMRRQTSRGVESTTGEGHAEMLDSLSAIELISRMSPKGQFLVASA